MIPKPITRRDNVTETLHGLEIVDPYRWLEDQESSETRAWIDNQIAYTTAVLASYSGRENIVSRLSELLKVESATIPLLRNGMYFFASRRPDEQQYVIYKRHSVDGANEVLIDPNGMSSDNMVSASMFDVSSDAALVAYGLRVGGADEVEIRFRDTQNGEDWPDVLASDRYFSVSIGNDNKSVYYVRPTANGPRLFAHKFGDEVSKDEVLFGEGISSDKIISASLTEDGKYLLVTTSYGSAALKTDIHLLDLGDSGKTRTIVDSISAKFFGKIAGSYIYLHTTLNAPNGRVLKASINTEPNDISSWKEIVPARPDASLVGFYLCGGKLCLNYVENVSSRIIVVDPDGQNPVDMPSPENGNIFGPFGEWDNPEAFYHFVSFATPPSIYRWNVDTGSTSIWFKSAAASDSASIVVRQVFFTSKDGTRIPMFLVHGKDLLKDGERPVYLTGYGGFNLPQMPNFSALATTWAESGGIYALANLRGGGEFGEGWHEAGMLDNKQNVFDDFYAAAEWLISEGYTRPSCIGISGRSNGGLLVGAAITQRPELFGSVICGYPLLDMVRYHQFLVAGYWVPEYGSSEDAEQFRTLLSYSPYHHVQAASKYPPIMFVTGDADTRVAPLHARKMTALMQSVEGFDNLVLLNYDVKSGHSTGKPTDEVIKDMADDILFLRNNLCRLS